jgi:uncharacterized protein YfaS (alpha-2-macroglobulin family)
MQTNRHNLKKILLVAGIVFGFYTASAQVNYNSIAFRIDSLADIGLPKSALKEVDQLDALARKNNNPAQQVRAALYRMNFQSYLEENALDAIITRLKTNIKRADYPVKPILQSLLAQMYWNYYQQNRYKFNDRTRLAKADSDFTRWDLRTIVDQTSHLYTLSLQDAARGQNTPVDVLDGVLTGDINTRYLRPTLYDLLVQRAFDFFLNDEASLQQPKLPFSVNDPRFFADNRTFARLTIKTSDTTSIEYKGIKYLQQATNFHLTHTDEEALADLDMQRLKFLYDRSNAINKDSLYLSTLRQIAAQFTAKPISSEALVLQGQYLQDKDSLKAAHDIFQRAAEKLPKSLGGKDAMILMRQIEEKELSASVENVNMLGKPILALLNYRNIRKATVSIYRLSPEQVKKIISNDSGYEDEGITPTDAVRKLLKSIKPVQVQELTPPETKDYRKHSAEFKIDPLNPGTYIILVKDALSNSQNLTSLTGFVITRLAYAARVNPSGETEIRVMDRETGAKIKDAKINISRWVEDKNGKYHKDVKADGFSDQDGKFLFKISDDQDIVSLSCGGDSFADNGKYFYGNRETVRYDQSTISTILFTDRQLYRPGQTIYFKAMQISTTNGKSVVLPQTAVTVNFRDINGKTISSLDLRTNDFGSVQGTFLIPQNIPAGQEYLATNNGSLPVRVEEYKRPTFQLTFLPVTGAYRLNDSVKVKGKVTAFSGYGLSNARVAVHITRQVKPRFYVFYGIDRRSFWGDFQEIGTDTVHTDDKGEFTLSFKAPPTEKGSPNDAYGFKIDADATDESGETQSASTTVTVSDDPLEIDADLPPKLLPGDDASFTVRLNNVNGQPEKGKIQIKIIALKLPGRVFKNRLWDSPDQSILSKAEFKAAFPSYAWKDEDDVSKWAELGIADETDSGIADTSATSVDLAALKKQAAGIYKVVITAKDVKGDTTSLTQFVDVITTTGNSQKIGDWISPVKTHVKPGENADFMLDFDQPAQVLVEQYDGATLVASKWFPATGKTHFEMKIPANATPKNSFSMQFLAVLDNRLYHSYQRITIEDTVKKLNIKFLTFRDKLQPGEKETWKLQIKSNSNEQVSAELLAGLYDASLNDIAPEQYWQTGFEYAPYQPDYFAWTNDEFVKTDETGPFEQDYQDYSLKERNYEQLNLFGYNYYGNGNSNYEDYLQGVEGRKKAAINDAALNKRYAKNAVLVKNGFDVSGKVVAYLGGDAIPGVRITIKGTDIFTNANSAGYFRIKVPANGILIFKQAQYWPRQQNAKPASAQLIVLYDKRLSLKAIKRANPGVKYLKGDKDSDVTIDEPVGSADTKVTEEDANKVAQVRFVSPVVKADMEVAEYAPANASLAEPRRGYVARKSEDKVVMREIRTNPNAKYDKELLIRPPITPRTNFAETAFFYPQLHTDEKGQVLIDFTIPESLTRWKFRALAHTKDLATGYAETEVVTQKQLSISANTPRFLREGDTIIISARLANLTGGKLKGKVQLQLFNAVNMQQVNLFVNKADAEQDFDVEGNANKALSFKLAIPAGLDALDYKLTADAGEFTDGEENTLPVLPNRTLVTESMPMMVRAGHTKDFTFEKFVNQNSPTLKNKTLTLEYTSNPAWYAVQALPYMMEFPYECSEQVFSRYFANSLGSFIINKNPVIKQVFDQWKSTNSTALLSNLEKNQELKATLIEETPWLRDAENESEQKKRIALLFDLNKMSDELKLALDKLQKRQLPSGAFTWFGGDYADRYITQHIVEGIGELYHIGIGKDDAQLRGLADNALGYLDGQILIDEKARKKEKQPELDYGDLEIYAWYTRSFYLDRPMDKGLKSALANYLTWAADEWKFRNVYEQGMIALTTQRYGKADVTAQIERSLLETAQQSDELGMYWAKNRLGYFWYESPIETQSLLIDLFTEAGDNAKPVDEMKIWLLRNKQTNNWQTTKATAAACYALLLKGGSLLPDTAATSIKLNGKPLSELKPDIKADAGTGYIKTSWADDQIKPAMGKVQVKNNGTIVSWGAMHWQYLENLDKITSSSTNIHLQRKYFIQMQTDAGPVLTGVDATHQPKTGDLLKVVVYLTADRDFEYVQLKDMRPAGTEPVDALSTYKYQDGLYYYQVTKDVATNFFISELYKGSYVFEYRLRVAQPGNFSTGITSIQCMYAPEFNGHSEGGRIVVKP